MNALGHAARTADGSPTGNHGMADAQYTTGAARGELRVPHMPAVTPTRECPDGLHTWILVWDYHGRECFSVTALDVQPDGVTATVDWSADSDEIVEVHSERLVCRNCPAERGDVTSVDYR